MTNPDDPRDAARKYHAAIALLAQSAEQDKANDLAVVLESAASAISLGLLPEMAKVCVDFWQDRTEGAVPDRAPKAHAAERSVKRK